MLRQALQGYRQVARRPAFRRFWLGMMLSRAGDAFTVVALSWVVLGLAGPVQLGLVLMCFGLPRMASAPLAGHLLDGSRPGLLLAADNAARGLLIAAVPVLLWQHRLTVADLYGIAAACALLSPMTEVAEAALVPRLVADDHLDAANALLSANWEVAGIAGPAVAGLIVATVGAPLALLLDAASFAVMAVICLNLPFRPPARQDVPAAGRRSRLGFGLLFRFPAVLVLTACGFGMLFLDGVATVLYPRVLQDVPARRPGRVRRPSGGGRGRGAARRGRGPGAGRPPAAVGCGSAWPSSRARRCSGCSASRRTSPWRPSCSAWLPSPGVPTTCSRAR